MTGRVGDCLRIIVPLVAAIALLGPVDATPAIPGPRAQASVAETTPSRVTVTRTITPSIEVVGQIGGPATAIAARGPIGYAGVGARFVVLEAGDDGVLRTLAETAPLADMIADISLDGDRAVLVTDQAEVIVVDVADPTRPTEIGRLALVPAPIAGQLPIPSSGTRELPAIDVADGVAYVTVVHHGLFVVDLAEPARPAIVGHADATTRPGRYMVDVAVTTVPGAGVRAVVACQAGGLAVYDVAQPSAPREVARWARWWVAAVDADGGRAYVAAWDEARLEFDTNMPVADATDLVVLDLTAPDGAPRQVGALVMPGGATAWSVSAAGAHVYLGAGLAPDTDLWIANVADPAAPVVAGGFDVAARATGPGRQLVAASASRVWLAAGDTLQVVDVREPARPRGVGAYRGWTAAPALWADASRAAVAALAGGLRVFDVSDPANVRETGVLAPGWSAADVDVCGGTAYVATGRWGLRIVDPGGAPGPREVGAYVPDLPVRRVRCDGEIAWIVVEAEEGPHLSSVRVADPSAHALVGDLELEDAFLDLAVRDSVAYVLVSRALLVIDGSRPDAPVEIGRLEIDADLTTVATAGPGRVVLTASVLTQAGSTWRTALSVIDVADPRRPVRRGTARFDGVPAHDVFATDARAFVASSQGVGVFDIADPDAPVLAGSVAGFVSAVGALGDRGYLVQADDVEGVVSEYSTLAVWDMADPIRPRRLGAAPRVDAVWASALDDGYLYSAGDFGAVAVMDVRDAAHPRLAAALPITSAGALDVLDGVAYVATLDDTTFATIDVSVPERPRLLGAVGVPDMGYATYLEATGDHVFVSRSADGFESPAVLAIDVRDPSAPSHVGTYVPADTAAEMVYAFAVRDGFAYVPLDGLRVVDVRDPSRMTEVGRFAWSDEEVCGYTIALAGGVAYTIDDRGLNAFDVSSPAAPRLLWTEDPSPVAWLQAFREADGTWRLSGIDDFGLTVYDALGDGRLREVISVPVPGAADVQVAAARAYVTTAPIYLGDVPPGLEVIDVSAGAAPGPRDAGSYISWSHVAALDVSGDIAYVASEDGGLRTIAVADPARPREVALSLRQRRYRDVSVTDPRAYAAGVSAIDVLDVTDPAAPVVLGSRSVGESPCPAVATVDLPGTAHGGCIVAAGDTALYRARNGVRRLDASDPTAPRVDAELVAAEYYGPTALDVARPFALLGTRSFGAHVLDVSTESELTTLASALGRVPVVSVALDGRRGYVVTAARDDQLQVLDLTWPTAPVVVGSVDAIAGLVDVAAPWAWVAGGRTARPGEVRVLDVGGPSAPVETARRLAWWHPADVVAVGDVAYVGSVENGLWVYHVEAQRSQTGGYIPYGAR